MKTLTMIALICALALLAAPARLNAQGCPGPYTDSHLEVYDIQGTPWLYGYAMSLTPGYWCDYIMGLDTWISDDYQTLATGYYQGQYLGENAEYYFCFALPQTGRNYYLDAYHYCNGYNYAFSHEWVYVP